MEGSLNLFDLGDAVVETKQASAYPMTIDNMGQFGWF